MKHIKEYQVFEKEDAQGKVSEELKKKYPKLSSALKSEFIYFFTRGLSGYFDIKENDKEQDILVFVPSEGSIPPIEFNLYFIPGNIEATFQMEPVDEPYKDLLQKDVDSIKAFCKHLQIPDWSNDYLSQMRMFNNTFDAISKWPNIKASSTTWFGNSRIQYYEPYLRLILNYAKYLKSGKVEAATIGKPQIQATPAFKEFLGIGGQEITTQRIWNNGNLKLTHPILAYNTYDYGGRQYVKGMDSITIHSSGPIRVTSADRPAVINSAPGFLINSLDGWEQKIAFVTKFLKKRIAKNIFGITSTKQLEEISSLSTSEYWEKLIDLDAETFFSWLESQGDNFMNTVIGSGLDLRKYIASDPAKAAITLKKVYKHSAVKSAITKLSPNDVDDFTDQLTLSGNLGELGF